MTGVAPELLARQGLTPADFEAELKVLTKAERTVLTALSKGYGTKEAAGVVYMSVTAVNRHRFNGLQKLQCTLIECAVMMAKAGWI